MAKEIPTTPREIRYALIEQLLLSPDSVPSLGKINQDTLKLLEKMVREPPLTPDPDRHEAHRYENVLVGRTLYDEEKIISVLKVLGFRRMRVRKFPILTGRLWRAPDDGVLAYKRWGPYHCFAISVFYLPGDPDYRYYDQRPPTMRGKKR